MHFSIVIPTCRPTFLRQAVESVIDQTHEDWELIIKDIDEGTGYEQIADYVEMDSRVKYFHCKDLNMSDALNQGLRETSGDILSYLSDDDVLVYDTLEYVNKHLWGKQWGYGPIELFDGVRAVGYQGLQPLNYDQLKQQNDIASPGVFWTRVAWNKLGCFNQGLDLVADYDYWLRLMYQYPTYSFFDKVMGRCRLHPKQLRRNLVNERMEQEQLLHEQVEAENG